MKTLKELFIEAVVGEVVGKRAAEGRPLRILDLGCGTAFYVPALIAKFPNIEYVGVEPIKASYEIAKNNLVEVSKAKVIFQLGYEKIDGEEDASFDLVFSLSVLEHIKHLDKFIALSAKYLTAGGTMVHRYDLGHALYPHSIKERIHVCLGNHIPSLLPERQFVRYVPENEVRAHYQKYGVTPTKTTYHQMRDAKTLEKALKEKGEASVMELFAWEMRHQDSFNSMTVSDKEHLFPAVAVWGEKN